MIHYIVIVSVDKEIAFNHRFKNDDFFKNLSVESDINECILDAKQDEVSIHPIS